MPVDFAWVCERHQPALEAAVRQGLKFRLLGNRTGNWTTTRVEVAIEAISLSSPPAASDMHWVAASAPNSRGEIYIFADSMLWGNGLGQKVKLWMRKTSGCGFSTGTFDVGERYLSLKLIPTDGMSCFNN